MSSFFFSLSKLFFLLFSLSVPFSGRQIHPDPQHCIKELAELDDEQDDLEDGDDFSEDEDDDLPSSSDGEEERIIRQGAMKGQEQLDTSVDLDDPRPRTPLLPQNTSMDESSDHENYSPKASPAQTNSPTLSPVEANSPPPPHPVCVASLVETSKRTPDLISRDE